MSKINIKAAASFLLVLIGLTLLLLLVAPRAGAQSLDAAKYREIQKDHARKHGVKTMFKKARQKTFYRQKRKQHKKQLYGLRDSSGPTPRNFAFLGRSFNASPGRPLTPILETFRAESAANGLAFPDSVTIEYAKLGQDTLGVATRLHGHTWHVRISYEVEDDILETVVYHELGHVAGLDHCRGRSIMNYGYLLPLTPTLKKRLFMQIRQFQKLCNPVNYERYTENKPTGRR